MDDPVFQRQDPVYLGALERLTLAWAELRKVRVWHRHDDEAVYEYTFAPYFIEPYAVGQTTHVIGLRQPPGEVRTFKVERLERVELLHETYEIPPDFDPRAFLRSAWGIWFTEGKPVRVVLQFAGRVARRVKETRWHPSQEMLDLPGGGVRWQAEISEPRVMLPWIRGWGTDVEVVEPEEVRDLMRRESQKTAQLYNAEILKASPKYWQFWAKAEKSQDPDVHLLIYHLLDVGECALALWNFALADQTKQLFANYLNLNIEAAGRQLAFWASLHDLGKASPGFQKKYAQRISILEMEGFIFPQENIPGAAHGIVSTWALSELLTQETGLSKPDARMIAFALGGHHGAWPTSDLLLPSALKRADKGDEKWEEARRQILTNLKEIYQPVNDIRLPAEQNSLNAFLTLFSGLVSVADWIGSISDSFPFHDYYIPGEEYADRAKKYAKAALEKLGWLGWQVDDKALTFSGMFPFISMPNDIQQRTIEVASGPKLPALVILEAPTGTGKTEAALYLADTWLHSQKGRGIYVAMPTQATSNQMFDRVTTFLTSRYPGESIHIHLVHGAAQLKDENAPRPKGIADDGGTLSGNLRAETWFLPRKRTLLAPFGVGTVDQALIGVLQTRHFFVRMFGLGQKVLIFDEVHAYDTYMSTLFERLLAWLRSIGTSVILLSATLPEQTRKAFLEAWTGNRELKPGEVSYPRLTIASDHKIDVHSLPPPPTRSLMLEWVGSEVEEITRILQIKLASGGCAAVICNRVRRAQEVYEVLKQKGIVEPYNLILFHARFPFEWRKDIEDRVLKLFSKGANRPRKAIVVATQVIEQSLDLDFDYMLTDIAPVDLLLQRAGRLHRHPQNDQRRPAEVKSPYMAIARPKDQNGLPDFGLDARVYEKSILLRTWLALHSRDQIALPDETEGLIETVYGNRLHMDELTPDFSDALQKAEEKARLRNDKEIFEAKKRMIAKPDDEGLVGGRNEGLEEDDARVNQAFRALTRLSDPSISLICLHETSKGVTLEPDGTGKPLDLNKQPDFSQISLLLRHAVSVQRQDIVDYFVNNIKIPAAWRQLAALRDQYPVVFDANGEYHPEGTGFRLRLTRELGLEVLKEAQ